MRAIAIGLMVLGLSLSVGAQEVPDTDSSKENSSDDSNNDSGDDADETAQKRWRIGGGVSYVTASELNFRRVDVNGTSYEYDYKASGAPAFALEAKYGGVIRSWGIRFGLQVDYPRKITEVEAKTGGVTTKTLYPSGSEPKLTIANFYASAHYEWEHLYLPFGVNVSGISIGSPPAELKDARGSYGVQAGVGWEFNEHVSAELTLRTLSIVGKRESNITTGSTELAFGSLSGAQAGLKAYF